MKYQQLQRQGCREQFRNNVWHEQHGFQMHDRHQSPQRGCWNDSQEYIYDYEDRRQRKHDRFEDGRMRCHKHGRGYARGSQGGRGRPGGKDFNPLDGHRRVGADELQLIVLALLEEKPRHGYDIIKHLSAFTHGFYSPSPGMIYPVLTYLEESGLVGMSMEGNKKSYTLTEQGQTYLNDNREHVEILMERLAQVGKHMYRMQQSYAQEVSESLSTDTWHEAIRALRNVLRDKHSASDAEKERISAILMRVLKEISG